VLRRKEVSVVMKSSAGMPARVAGVRAKDAALHAAHVREQSERGCVPARGRRLQCALIGGSEAAAAERRERL